MGPASAAILPPRRLLERQNAELAAELLAAQQATGQLSARLDASRTLCDQLQRALVDATGPQVPSPLLHSLRRPRNAYRKVWRVVVQLFQMLRQVVGVHPSSAVRVLCDWQCKAYLNSAAWSDTFDGPRHMAAAVRRKPP